MKAARDLRQNLKTILGFRLLFVLFYWMRLSSKMNYWVLRIIEIESVNIVTWNAPSLAPLRYWMELSVWKVWSMPFMLCLDAGLLWLHCNPCVRSKRAATVTSPVLHSNKSISIQSERNDKETKSKKTKSKKTKSKKTKSSGWLRTFFMVDQVRFPRARRLLGARTQTKEKREDNENPHWIGGQDHFDSTVTETTDWTSSPAESRLWSERLGAVAQLQHVLVQWNTHKWLNPFCDSSPRRYQDSLGFFDVFPDSLQLLEQLRGDWLVTDWFSFFFFCLFVLFRDFKPLSYLFQVEHLEQLEQLERTGAIIRELLKISRRISKESGNWKTPSHSPRVIGKSTDREKEEKDGTKTKTKTKNGRKLRWNSEVNGPKWSSTAKGLDHFLAT